MIISKAESGLALTVLNRQKQFGIKRRGDQPRNARPRIAQAICTEKTPVDQWLIDKVPAVWMRRIKPAKLREELPGLDLQVPRQRHGFQIGLFGLDAGFAFRIDLQHDVGLAAKVRVHLAVEYGLQVLHGESTLVRIMAAQLRAALDIVGR